MPQFDTAREYRWFLSGVALAVMLTNTVWLLIA